MSWTCLCSPYIYHGPSDKKHNFWSSGRNSGKYIKKNQFDRIEMRRVTKKRARVAKAFQFDGNVSLSTATEKHLDDHVTWQMAVKRAYDCIRTGETQAAIFWFYHAGNKAA